MARRHRGHSRGRVPAYLAGRGARRFPRFPVRRRAAAGAAGQTPTPSRRHPCRPGGDQTARARIGGCGERPLRRLLRAALRRAPLSRSSTWPTRRRSRPAGRCAQRARPRCSSAAASITPRRATASATPTSTALIAYRKHLVANCTCNGRDAFGLAPLRGDQRSDVAARATSLPPKDGLLAYTGDAARARRSRRSTRPAITCRASRDASAARAP